MVLGGASHSHPNGVHTMSTNDNFDTRLSVEERYSEHDRLAYQYYNQTNNAIRWFGILVMVAMAHTLGWVGYVAYMFINR
jgi:hypothetical protein